MKDSNSIFQITLLKAIIVIYFLYIILNSLGSSVSFFHDNAEFGIWAIISFFMISSFILFVDIAIIYLVCKTFKDKNKRVYILIFQSIIFAFVYFGLNYMFENADKWNEYAINDSQNSVDTLQTDSAEKQTQNIYVIDKSQYDQIFIDGLADYNEPIKLIGNYIIIGKDTTYFPEDLSLNKSTTFRATKDDNKFLLTVKRTNLTNLTYRFQLTDKDNKTVDAKTGKAILSSSFFIGSEGDDDITGGYGSQEYRDNSNDTWLSIRIEIGKANNGKQRAKIHYDSSDKTKKSFNLDLEECPTLWTE